MMRSRAASGIPDANQVDSASAGRHLPWRLRTCPGQNALKPFRDVGYGFNLVVDKEDLSARAISR